MSNNRLDYYRRVTEAQNNVSSGVINTNISYSSTIPTGSLRAANSVKLPASASSVNNYYVDYSIIVDKVLPNGTTYRQKKDIVAYNGSTKIAVISDVWDYGYEPAAGDSYKIELTYPDARVTTNTIMQLGDYLTSSRYGRDLKYDFDLKLDTFKKSARKCDSRSDVVLKSVASINVGKDTVYSYSYVGILIWEGTVRSNYTGLYVPFTKVLGKITNRWNSWKRFNIGDIIYHENRTYLITETGVKTTAPTHGAGNINGVQGINQLLLTKVGSGVGPSTISLNLSTNPVLDVNAKGEEISGYSLYDCDSIDYWRRLGWDDHTQASVTLYQTNFSIDTSVPMFDNINMMLEHCNGIFSYSEGKYSIDIEDIPEEVIEITQDDIIGKISLEDSGSKSSYNSLTVSYIDPANNFEARNISLFSDSYLKQDRRVPKKGNITVVGITNYYNVRLLADSFLKRSRFNASITMTLFPEFVVILPGNVISVTYPRYSWSGKRFRVDSVTIKENGAIGIVAKEYDASFYSLTNMNKAPAVGQSSPLLGTSTTAPTNLKATNTVTNNQLNDGILLKWTNAPGLSATTQIEIYSSDTPVNPIVVTSINNNQLTLGQSVNLKIGSKITANASGFGIIKDMGYFVVSIQASNIITISENYGGTPLALTNTGNAQIEFSTFSLVQSLAYPETSFLHTFPNITSSIKKYYKIRYRTEK